jgi:hypothetical protein
MFVNESTVDKKYGFPSRTTIDHQRGMELTEVKATYGEILFVLNVKGHDILFDASYRFTGENKNTIEYFVRSVGYGLPPKYDAHKFTSRDEKLQIVEYVGEALEVFGLHHERSPEQSVLVRFSENALSFSEGAR